MYMIKESSKNIISKMLGMDFEDVVDMDYDEEIQYIQSKNQGRVLSFNPKRKNRVGRGNPLLSRRRFKTLSEVNEGLARIK